MLYCWHNRASIIWYHSNRCIRKVLLSEAQQKRLSKAKITAHTVHGCLRRVNVTFSLLR